MAHVYQWSHTLPRCLITAAKYYTLAIENGYENAINDIEGLKKASDMTAEIAIKIACMYQTGTGDGVSKNEAKAREWYDLACELAIRNRKEKNGSPALVVVANYYYQCSKNNDKQAQSVLELLPLTVTQWYTLGENYYFGRNGIKKDLVFAHRCYQKTGFRYAARFGELFRRLDVIVWQGGLKVDKEKAEHHYKQALLSGCFEAHKCHLLITHPMFIADQSWYDLGREYEAGIGGKQQDYVKSLACYEIAIKKNERHAASLHALGLLFQYGRGTKVNLATAKAYYEKGVQAHHESSQFQLNIIANPILSHINSQTYQSHVIRVEYCIEKTMRMFSWVHNSSLDP